MSEQMDFEAFKKWQAYQDFCAASGRGSGAGGASAPPSGSHTTQTGAAAFTGGGGQQSSAESLAASGGDDSSLQQGSAAFGRGSMAGRGRGNRGRGRGGPFLRGKGRGSFPLTAAQTAALNDTNPDNWMPHVSEFKGLHYDFGDNIVGTVFDILPFSNSRKLLAKAMARITENSTANLTGSSKRKFNLACLFAELLPGFALNEEFVPDRKKVIPSKQEQADTTFQLVKHTFAPDLQKSEWDHFLTSMGVNLSGSMFSEEGAVNPYAKTSKSPARDSKSSSMEADELRRENDRLKKLIEAKDKSSSAASTTPAPEPREDLSPVKRVDLKAKWNQMTSDSPSPSTKKSASTLSFTKNIDYEADRIPKEIKKGMSAEKIDEIVMGTALKHTSVPALLRLFPDNFKWSDDAPSFDMKNPKKYTAWLLQTWRMHVFQKVLGQLPPGTEVSDESPEGEDDDEDDDDDVQEVVDDDVTMTQPASTAKAAKQKAKTPAAATKAPAAKRQRRKSTGSEPEVKQEAVTPTAPKGRGKAASAAKGPAPKTAATSAKASKKK